MLKVKSHLTYRTQMDCVKYKTSALSWEDNKQHITHCWLFTEIINLKLIMEQCYLIFELIQCWMPGLQDSGLQ